MKRARVRHFTGLVLDQAAFSLALAMGAAIVLLLVGTEILAWYWLAVIFGGGLAVGVWRTTRRFPSAYKLAQSVDRGLGLHDALSTALHFRDHPGHADPVLREEQRRRAEELARSADVRRALPFARPRSLYVSAGLALAAITLFGLRYGVTRTLDLHQSLVELAFDTFFPPSPRTAQARRSPLQKKIADEMKKIGINVDAPDAKGPDAAPDSVLDVVDEPNVDSTAPEAAKSKAEGKNSKDNSGDPDTTGENPEKATPGSEQNARDNSSPSKDGASQAGKSASPSASQQSPNGAGDNNSLLNKMRDAMADLLNKLKIQPKSGDGRQTASKGQNGNLQSGASP
ncbi:MAG: hypothetical protein ACREH9_03370, partial [Pseudomonadota bacterium]